VRTIVFSDCHKNGPTPSKVVFQFGFRVFYIGDNHEFKNLLKKLVSKCTAEYRSFLVRCRETGTKVLNGNHEVEVGEKYLGKKYIIDTETNTLFVHGDYPLYSQEKWNKWHTMKAGCGRFKLMFIKLKNAFRDHGFATKLSEEKIKIFSDLAKKHEVKNIGVRSYSP